MSTRFRPILAAALAAVSFQAPASADLIFDNSSGGNRGIITTSSPQLAEEVTAAPGTSRSVTELDIGFTSQGVPSTADIQAFIYANDGAGGTPGTLLWQSALIPGVAFDSVNTLYAFSVPSVVVPDTFSFAVSITDDTGLVGLAPASGATTGTLDQVYDGSPGSWQALSPAFEFEGRVLTSVAVPGPATFALLGVGLAGSFVLGRSRRPTP